MSTIILGKCVIQDSKPKEMEFVWIATKKIHSAVLLHEQQVENKKESLDMEHP
jgi:hypothetical protein